MNVLALTNLYPSRREPTRGLFNEQAFVPLSRLCGLRIVSPRPWWTRTRTPQEWLQAPYEEATGVPATFPTYWSVPGRTGWHSQGMYHSLRGQVRRMHRETPFDVILASWACPDGVAAAHLARELGCPVVTMVLGSDLNEFARHAELREQIRWGLSQATRVITVSAALRDRVMELGIPGENVVVQHNGVDGERFQIRDRNAVRQALGLDLQRPLITYVGNLKPEKGGDLLIEAMGALRAAGDHATTLALIGDGPLDAPLRSRVAELGLGEQVRFCGRQLHQEIPKWISAANVLCLPSRREGCPNVVLEALASGRPVVAAAVGGVPELLSRGNGIMVRPEDPADLAKGLATALNRSWEPEALRQSVPYLSWADFANTLHQTLATSVAAYGRRQGGRELQPAHTAA